MICNFGLQIFGFDGVFIKVVILSQIQESKSRAADPGIESLQVTRGSKKMIPLQTPRHRVGNESNQTNQMIQLNSNESNESNQTNQMNQIKRTK